VGDGRAVGQTAARGDGDRDVLRIEHALAELMRLAGSRRIHDARMRAVGLALSRTELRFLARIDEVGPLSVSALADELDVSQPTASRTLRRLEEERMVRRRAHSSDGRVAIYDITAKGRRERGRVQQFMHGQLAGALADVPARRRHDLAVLMEDMATRLRRGGAHERSVS
jgi:DNA-binding MarR family transcriptional regulator